MTHKNHSSAQAPQFPMSEQELELLLAHLIRCPEVIIAALDKLNPELFSGPYEVPYRLMWMLAQDYYITHRETMSKLYMVPQLKSRVAMAPELLQFAQKLDDLVNWIYSAEISDFNASAGKNLLQQFLDERVFKAAVATNTFDPSSTLEALSKIFSTTRVNNNNVVNVFDFTNPDMNEMQTPSRATGCTVFDRLTDGGWRPRHMTGILAPFGGGKTLLTLDLAVNTAKQKVNVLVCQYEQNVMQSIRPRVWSNATQIPTKVFAENKLNQLDKAILQKLSDVSGIGQFLHFVDLSTPPAGVGGAMEIENIVIDMQSRGCKPDMIIIDWLGLLVRHYLMAKNLPFETHAYSCFDEMIARLRKIANTYNSEVVITHQLNATAGAKGAGSRASMYDSANYKAFAAVMDTCIMISKHTDDGFALIYSDKNRGARDECVVKVRGDICKFEVRDNPFTTFSDSSGKVRLLDARRISDVSGNVPGVS